MKKKKIDQGDNKKNCIGLHEKHGYRLIEAGRKYLKPAWLDQN